MSEAGEPHLPRFGLEDPAICTHPEPPTAFHSTEWLDVETGTGPHRLFGEQIERLRETPLDVPGEATELALSAGLEQDLR